MSLHVPARLMGELTALEGVKQFPVRIECALLGWATVVDAIADYQKAHD